MLWGQEGPYYQFLMADNYEYIEKIILSAVKKSQSERPLFDSIVRDLLWSDPEVSLDQFEVWIKWVCLWVNISQWHWSVLFDCHLWQKTIKLSWRVNREQYLVWNSGRDQEGRITKNGMKLASWVMGCVAIDYEGSWRISALVLGFNVTGQKRGSGVVLQCDSAVALKISPT